MQAGFWRERWATGQIGFHEGKPNDLLMRAVQALDDHRRVLVPLAGKAQDMLFLRQRGHDVVGVEVVEPACRQFFDENHLDHTVEERGVFRAFVATSDRVRGAADADSDRLAASLELLCGDIFDATPARLGLFDAVYDRAALVALDPATRERYVDTLRSLLVPGGRVLLITFSYDQECLPGPPWSVDETTVQALFGAAFDIQPLEAREVERGPKFVQAGVTSVREHIFLLIRR